MVYSSDFPWLVHLQPLFPEQKFEQHSHPMASCNGATYLWQYVRDKNPAIVLPIVNWYVAPDNGENVVQCQKLNKVESRGFRSTYFWSADGTKTPDRSRRAVLSVVDDAGRHDGAGQHGG